MSSEATNETDARRRNAANEKANKEKETAAAEEQRRLEEQAKAKEEEERNKVPEKPNPLALLRESPLRAAAFLRYQVAQDNKLLGDEGRQERDERLIRKEFEANQWIAQGRERVNERTERQKRSRKLKQKLVQTNCDQVRAEREQRLQARKLLVESQAEHYEKARQRVAEASRLRAKLAAAETATAKSTAAEGKRSKEMLTQAAAAVRQQLLITKQAMAAQIKQLHAKAIAETGPQLVSAAAARGNEKRVASRQLGLERGRREVSYIERARMNRERALKTRQAAKAAMAEAMESRKLSAARERANDKLVAEERARIRERNQRGFAAIYRQRFASEDEASEYAESEWNNLLAAAVTIAAKNDQPQASQRENYLLTA